MIQLFPLLPDGAADSNPDSDGQKSAAFKTQLAH